MKRMFLPLVLAAAAGPAAAIQAQGSNPPGGRESGAEYTVKLNPSERRGTVAPGIFGHMVEMIGTTIYDGIWVGEDSNIPNDGGLRLDTIEAYRQLRAPAFRWPGGTIADSYRWKDGIGPRSQRPRIMNIWQEVEPNSFGTDEFLRWCAAIGAEPVIQTNIGMGDPSEILAWMEYANGIHDTQYAELRRKNGHLEPYGVKYWTIGNETSYHWTPELYAIQVRRYGFYMRQYATDAKIIINGEPDTDWVDRLLKALRDRLELFDLISVQCYLKPALAAESQAADTYTLLADVERCQEVIDLAAKSIDRWIGDRKDIGIMLDEWGSWHKEIDPVQSFPVEISGKDWMQPDTMRDALMAARMLHGFMRRAKRLRLAHLTESINIIHNVIKTQGPKLVRTPTFHVFDLLKHHMNMDVVGVDATIGGFGFVDEGRTRSLPDLDIMASANSDSSQFVVSVVNPHLSREQTVRLNLEGARRLQPAATVLTASGPLEFNDFQAPDRVRPAAASVGGQGGEWTLSCPPFSLTLVRFTAVETGS
ncbi:MAG: hypothetical protein OXT71_15995 [Acidobacteriota bacterium]|nr:hypothetical protein [Acidobacteriota bacterium]